MKSNTVFNFNGNVVHPGWMLPLFGKKLAWPNGTAVPMKKLSLWIVSTNRPSFGLNGFS